MKYSYRDGAIGRVTDADAYHQVVVAPVMYPAKVDFLAVPSWHCRRGRWRKRTPPRFPCRVSGTKEAFGRDRLGIGIGPVVPKYEVEETYGYNKRETSGTSDTREILDV